MNNPENNHSDADLEGILGEDEGSIDLSDQPTGGDAKESPDQIEVVETLLDETADPDAGVPKDESIESELEKFKDLAARSQADLENYRKRMARERTEAIQYANFSLLSSLLPVIDNFEMGLKMAKSESGSVIYQGMAMVQKQLHDFLSENRVEQIEVAEGADFDPNLHEAIKEEASETVAEGKVIYSMRNGYRLKDRLLRPANVVVSKGPAGAQSGGEEE